MALTDEVLPLPPLSQVASPAPKYSSEVDPSAAGRRLKLLPVLFVTVFALLLASFPARNSDLWKHLAAGRELVGAPQELITAVQHPADHLDKTSWLYDVACYSLY